MLTLPRALAIITVSYAAAAVLALALFRFVAHVRGDAEPVLPMNAFAGIAALAWLFSCVSAWRDFRGVR